MTNDEIIERPVRESVRRIDAMESENVRLHEKSVENHNFIDKEERSVFPSGLSVASLKYSFRLNVHGKGEYQINEVVVDNYFPRCSDLEHWNHVTQCGYIESKRNKCLRRIRKKLDKA